MIMIKINNLDGYNFGDLNQRQKEVHHDHKCHHGGPNKTKMKKKKKIMHMQTQQKNNNHSKTNNEIITKYNKQTGGDPNKK